MHCTLWGLQEAHARLFPIDYDDNFYSKAVHGLDRWGGGGQAAAVEATAAGMAAATAAGAAGVAAPPATAHPETALHQVVALNFVLCSCDQSALSRLHEHDAEEHEQ
jgi:beta-phosphoglucomutase-like phosphatase (HAD superfamily)